MDVVALPASAAVIVPALKLPDPSRATMALAVFALVAFDVTVKVELPDWFAVNDAEPDKPVPDTAIVSVPLPTNAGVFVTVIDVAARFVMVPEEYLTVVPVRVVIAPDIPRKCVVAVAPIVVPVKVVMLDDVPVIVVIVADAALI